MREVRPPCVDACSYILQHHFVPALCPRDPAALQSQQDKDVHGDSSVVTRES